MTVGRRIAWLVVLAVGGPALLLGLVVAGSPRGLTGPAPGADELVDLALRAAHGLACGLTGWLASAAVLQLAAELVPALRAVADRCTPEALHPVRRAVGSVALGTALLTGPLPGPTPSPPAVATQVDPGPGGTATLVPLDAPTATSPSTSTTAPTSTTTTVHPTALGTPTTPAPSTLPTAPPAGAHKVVVARGDDLWHLAEAHLGAAWGRRPTDREVAPYWRAVVEANRARLVVPGEPSLIYAGQRVVLPPPPLGHAALPITG